MTIEKCIWSIESGSVAIERLQKSGAENDVCTNKGEVHKLRDFCSSWSTHVPGRNMAALAVCPPLHFTRCCLHQQAATLLVNWSLLAWPQHLQPWTFELVPSPHHFGAGGLLLPALLVGDWPATNALIPKAVLLRIGLADAGNKQPTAVGWWSGGIVCQDWLPVRADKGQKGNVVFIIVNRPGRGGRGRRRCIGYRNGGGWCWIWYQDCLCGDGKQDGCREQGACDARCWLCDEHFGGSRNWLWVCVAAKFAPACFRKISRSRETGFNCINSDSLPKHGAFRAVEMQVLAIAGEWCCWGDLNSRPLHYQWSALPLSYNSIGLCFD